MAQMALTADMTVGAAVAEYPALVRMFEALGIDFCCGGKRTLKDAAEGAKMPVDTLLAVLQTTIAQAQQASAGERDWQDAPLDDLIEHIINVHHAFMYRELPRTDALLARVGRAHGVKHGDILVPLTETFTALRTEIEAHLADEEERIFPMIRRLQAGTVDAQISAAVRELENEHETAGEALARMRTLTHDYQTPPDACATYCALYDALQALERDLHQHIHLENNILFPRTQQLLAASEKAA